MEIGPYLLDTRLAVGGTAEVYLARKAGAAGAPRVVLKRPLPDFLADEEGRAMFVEEGRLQAAIDHPNVVRVLDRGATAENELYLVLEHVDGIDLFRLLRRARLDARPIDPGLTAYVGHEIAAGLAAVHAATDEQGQPLKIVHRDVTPSNVYLSRDGSAKIGDFGIALGARGRAGIAPSAVLKGKYAYLAPEQVSAEPVDARASWSCPAIVAWRSPLACDESGLPDAHALAMPTSNANIHAPSITMAVRRRVRVGAKRGIGCTDNNPSNVIASAQPVLALDQRSQGRDPAPRACARNATATDPRCRAPHSSAP